MFYIRILRRAQKELSRLSEPEYTNICLSIRKLGHVARPSRCSKLTGRNGWRVRVGDYRVIYEIDDQNKIITILHIGHRKDVYR